MSSVPPQGTGLEILDGAAARALSDPAYRQQLINDPRTVLREAGLEVSDLTTIVVHENTADTIHLVLPSQLPPEQLDVDSITLEDIESGIHF